MTVRAGTGTISGGSAVLSSAQGNAAVTITGAFDYCYFFVEHLIQSYPDFSTILDDEYRFDNYDISSGYSWYHPTDSACGYYAR